MNHAIRFHRTGGPEVLQWEAVEPPPPGPGEVRLRHHAVGLNFIDTYHRSGLYPLPLPSGLGMEGAGVVEAVGEGVSEVKAGDRVAYTNGPLDAYSEVRNIPARHLVVLPDDIAFEQGAAMMLQGITAQYLLHSTYAVKAGETILVHAAAGGAGRIVAAGVENDDRTGGEAIERRLHAGEVDAARGGVIVRIAFDDEAGGFEEGEVVFPGRIADMDRRLGVQALQVVGADLQRTGAAKRLGSDCLAIGEQWGVLAEQQVLYGLIVGRRAFDRLIATRRGSLQASLLGDPDGSEQRKFAVVIKIDADAEIDPGVARIGVEGFIQSENGVARGHFHRGKDRQGHRELHEIVEILFARQCHRATKTVKF